MNSLLTDILSRLSGRPSVILLLSIGLTACGGTKLLNEPVPITIGQPLASAVDKRLSVALDGVIVRDGPGTWARNADWDEYLIRIQNISVSPVVITAIRVYDSTMTRQDSSGERRTLLAESRQTARRYDSQDIEIKAGLGSGTLMAAGAVGGAAAVTAGSAALYMSSAAAATTVGVLLAAPALVAGGVVKSINQGRVGDEIARRQTEIPLPLEPGESKGLDLFFPLTPSPQKIEVLYEFVGVAGEYTLAVDTRAALNGLHHAPD
jgi:hypothetical protein